MMLSSSICNSKWLTQSDFDRMFFASLVPCMPIKDITCSLRIFPPLVSIHCKLTAELVQLSYKVLYKACFVLLVINQLETQNSA